MTTSEYISWLIKRVGGNKFSRQDLLDAVNQAQNEILGRDIYFMRVKPDPFLITADGTYRYVASTSIVDAMDEETTYDIRNVSRIYTFNVRRSPIFEYGGINRTSHRPEYMVNPMASDETVLPSDCEQSVAPNSSDCIIKLWRENNPGTTDDVYMAECYRWPTQLTSESVSLTIPDHFQRGLLKHAVLKDLEYTEYGAADKPEDLYKKELAKFDAWASRGATTRPTSTPPREC